jgi:hypothetical protein
MSLVKEVSDDVRSPNHLKDVRLARVRLCRDLNRGHMRPRRAVMAPGDECLYGALLPFHHSFHIAIEAVPYPAG